MESASCDMAWNLLSSLGQRTALVALTESGHDDWTLARTERSGGSGDETTA